MACPLFVGLAAAVFLASAADMPAVAALPETSQTIEQTTATADIHVEYPQTGFSPIDDDIAMTLKRQIADFLAYEPQALTPRSDQVRHSLDISFEVVRNDASGFAVVFTESTFEGGAHPNDDYVTVNYQRKDGWRLFLPEMLDGRRGLKRLLALAAHQLYPDPEDARTTADKPEWLYVDAFVLQPGSLILYRSDQMGGEVQATVPLAKLKDVMRPDWRVPVASFDCAKAGSTVEKAICSFMPLARLDRQLAETYATAMQIAAERPDKGAGLTAEQKVWLASRETVCHKKYGPDLLNCLSRMYRDRDTGLTHEMATLLDQP